MMHRLFGEKVEMGIEDYPELERSFQTEVFKLD